MTHILRPGRGNKIFPTRSIRAGPDQAKPADKYGAGGEDCKVKTETFRALQKICHNNELCGFDIGHSRWSCAASALGDEPESWYDCNAMADLDLRQRQRISAAEMARRREHVRVADTENRLEGITRNRATDPVFEAYIRGEIGATEIIPRLKAQHGPR